MARETQHERGARASTQMLVQFSFLLMTMSTEKGSDNFSS
jgi:hypothetical protein